MSNRPTNPPFPRSDPHRSGLLRAVLNTGRVRGSSATPEPVLSSPAPHRSISNKLVKMEDNSQPNSPHPSPAVYASSERAPGRGTATSTPGSNRGRGTASHGLRLSQGSQHGNDVSLRAEFQVSSRASQHGGSAHGDSQHGGPFSDSNRLPDSPSSQYGRQSSHNGSSSSQPTVQYSPGSFEETSEKLKRIEGQNTGEGLQSLGRLRGLIKDTGELSAKSKEIALADLHRVAEAFNQCRNAYATEAGHLARENVKLREEVQATRKNMETVTGERERAASDLVELQRDYDDLVKECKKLEKRWDKDRDSFNRTIQLQEEQLSSERPTWMNANPNESRHQKATSGMHDPFDSPVSTLNNSFTGSVDSMSIVTRRRLRDGIVSGNADEHETSRKTSNQDSSIPGSLRFPATQQQLSKSSSYRSSLPSGAAQKFDENDGRDYIDSHPFTEPGTPPQMKSGIFIPLSEADHEGPMFKAEISKLFGLVETFAQVYCNLPNPAGEQEVRETNAPLWEYMMNQTYPGRRIDSNVHVRMLLGGETTRAGLIIRMAMAYLVKDVLTIKTFASFSQQTDHSFICLAEAQKERGLANEARQGLIDRRAALVRSIITASSFNEFRNTGLRNQTKCLREMLGPLLNEDCDRLGAGKDLGKFAVAAWDLSSRIQASRLTFQMFFPEMDLKFCANTMKTCDRPKVHPFYLQQQQARLMLVMTPVITLRDDTTASVKTRTIHLAKVLTMK